MQLTIAEIRRFDPLKHLWFLGLVLIRIYSTLMHLRWRGVEQWLARWAHNPKAAGSNPAPAIFF
jgi:hypothetical protein